MSKSDTLTVFSLETANRSRRVALILLSMLFAVTMLQLAPPLANAYTLTGCKWSNKAITWTDKTNGYSGYQAPAIAGAKSWATLTDINDMRPYGGNMVPQTQNNGNNGYDGWTTWTCNGSSLSTAKVTVNYYLTKNYSSKKKQVVWAHEVGHGVGIGHSASGAMVMYTCAACVYSTYGYYEPRSDDINAANYLY